MTHIFRFLGRPEAHGWRIDGEEHIHLTRVLRLTTGTLVEVADGSGLTALGPVSAVHSSYSMVTASQLITHPVISQPIWLAIGALKASTIDELLPPLTEVGADEIVIYWQEGVQRDRIQDKVLVRWNRIIANAFKQSKRAYLPRIRVAESITAVTELFASHNVAAIYCDRGPSQSLTRYVPEPGRPAGIVIGGERGLNETELSLLKSAGYLCWSLGPHVLRAETAAIVSTACAAMNRQPQS